MRALFLGHVDTWPVILGALLAVGLLVAGLTFGARTFQRESG